MHYKLAKIEKEIGIVIEGDSLAVAIEKEKNKFYRLCCKAKSVVCCRANPKQKAKVVNFIKQMDKKAKTLAIGDGGNDTSMTIPISFSIFASL